MATEGKLRKQTCVHLLLILFVCLSVFYGGEGRRGNSSKKETTQLRRMCSSMRWFAKRQQNICMRQPDSIAKVKNGVETALKECRRQFKSYRWNCSPLTWNQVFSQDGILRKKSTETAFVQAISAAGVMREIAQGCAKGELKHCGCGVVTARKRDNTKISWQWSGCGDNLRYGAHFTRQFMDPRKITTHARRSTVHNHEVGRKIVRENYLKRCKCHGKSCAMKACWQVVPSIEKIGDEVWKLYQNPVRTRWERKTRSFFYRKDSRRQARAPVPEKSLSYFTRSEDFCQPKLSMSIMGTYGRSCNRTSTGLDGCATLCCGGRHKTNVVRKVVKCNCQFVWCCHVECQRCNKTVMESTCTS